MPTPVENLQQQAAQLHTDILSLEAAVEAENRTMTAEEIAKMEEMTSRFDMISQEITLRNRTIQNAERLVAPQPRKVEPQNYTPAPTTTATSPITGTVVAHNFANHGFSKGNGEYLIAVRAAATTGRVDPRLLVNAVTSWAGEAVGADGGFALPPQFTQGIMSLVNAEDSFVRALNAYPTQSDIITVPKDEDSPWATTAVTAAKTAEGAAITASKPTISQLKVPMYGVKSLVHVDEKSLRDMTFLSEYVTRKMGEKIRWKVENYVMNGTGENEPLGILNAPGLLTLAESDSTATTIGPIDVMKMEAMTLMGQGGFWIVHPTVLGLVRTLVSGTGGFPLFTPDFKQSPGGGLLGYPMFKSFASKPLNTTAGGDILFVKPDGYFLAFEQGGPQSATTIAFAFDQNLQSFRSTLYMGGAPTLSAKVLLPDATNYVSNLIALAGNRS